jgi:hypothetical protein
MKKDKKDFAALRSMIPPPKPRPRMPMAQVFQLYLTIIGWMLWMVVVGYFGLRAPDQPFAVNLSLSLVIAILTFVDLFGIWLGIGRWHGLRLAARIQDQETQEESSESGAGKSADLETGEGDASPAEAIQSGLFQSIPGPPERFRRELFRLAAASVLIALAILGTSISGWPLFLPGTGAVKGAIALSLSLWIFIEPIGRADDVKSRRGVLAVKTGLGLGLLCFASDHYFPGFGAAGIITGGIAATLGRRGAGIYAAVISGAAWGLQWWGVTLQ